MRQQRARPLPPGRIDRLAETVRVADEVVALASHQAVREWFQHREIALLGAIVDAHPGDRDMAIARVKAHRELRTLLAKIEGVHARNIERLDELTNGVQHG